MHFSIISIIVGASFKDLTRFKSSDPLIGASLSNVISILLQSILAVVDPGSPLLQKLLTVIIALIFWNHVRLQSKFHTFSSVVMVGATTLQEFSLEMLHAESEIPNGRATDRFKLFLLLEPSDVSTHC